MDVERTAEAVQAGVEEDHQQTGQVGQGMGRPGQFYRSPENL